MAWTNERLVRGYVDIIRQMFPKHTMDDALAHCVTLGLTCTGATWNYYDLKTWSSGTAVSGFETFMALAATVAAHYQTMQPATNLTTITNVGGMVMFGNHVKG